MLFGEFNLGKTFLALDWAACVSQGLPWAGLETKKRDVLFIASEGDPGGLGKRLMAWHKRWGHENLDIRVLVLPAVINVTTDITAVLDSAKDRGLRPGFVVIDTLAMAMSDEENSNTGMNGVIKALRKEQVYEMDGQEYEITFLLVHHTGWEGDRPRGGSAMPGGLDYVIGMKEDSVKEVLDVWMYKAKRSNKKEWGYKGHRKFRIRAFADDAVIESIGIDDYDLARANDAPSAGEKALQSFLVEHQHDVGFVIKAADVVRWSQDSTTPASRSEVSRAIDSLKTRGYLAVAPNSSKPQVHMNPTKWFLVAEDVEEL
jgi:hypothetical protein